MSEVIFFIFFFSIIACVLITFFTKKGKGVLFGGRIIKTYDGVLAKRKIFSNKVKVHAVDGGKVRLVGLEISTSSVGG